MKKIFFIVLCAVIVGCQFADTPKINATTILGDPDPFSIACITGFTRVAPHICMVTTPGSGSGQSFTAAAACAQQDLRTPIPTLPSAAQMIVIQVSSDVYSSNAVALRSNALVFHSGCGTPWFNYTHSIREMTATVNTLLSQDTTFYTVPLRQNRYIDVAVSSMGGTNSVVAFTYMGYYD